VGRHREELKMIEEGSIAIIYFDETALIVVKPITIPML